MPKIIRQRFEYEGRMVERTVVAEEDTLAPWGPGVQLSVVGRPTPRIDGVVKVTGAARYTADVQLPGMLHCRLLRSPYPNARLQGLDRAAAEAIRGVELILTAADCPEWLTDHPLCVGEAVAAVVAESEAIAEEALAALNPQWQPLPFVIDPEEALKEGAPLVDPAHPGNIRGGKPRVRVIGDPAAGRAAAEVLVELQVRTSIYVHHALEPHGCVAWWDGSKLTFWASTQGISDTRRELAKVHKLPVDRVRVIAEHVGGGFGAKYGPFEFDHIAVHASRRLGRPVRLFLDRREEGLMGGCRSASVQWLTVGARKDGTLTLLDLKSIGNAGCRGFVGPVGGPVREVYACPHIRTEEWQAMTHTMAAAAFRAPGYPEGAFALEQAMDELARRLGMDPLELRLKNYKEQDGTTPLPALRECYRAAAEASGWQTRAERLQPWRSGRRRRGMGIAVGNWGGGGAPPAHATVTVHPDGTATVMSATQDIGTGTRTAWAIIAAEEMGLPVDRINVAIGDTEGAPYGTGSGGSMTLASVGPAVRAAAADARRQLMALAADLLEAHVEDMAADGDAFHVKGSPEQRVTIAELMGRIGNFTITGVGARAPNPENYRIQTYCVQVAEVEVDTETGEITVLNLWSANESGRVINPLTTAGQVEGGAIQALGMALTEERVIDPASGIPLNADLENYRIPTALDVPHLAALLVDLPDPNVNNTGSKGVGEPPIIPGAAAIANAVYDAVGVRLTEIPATRARFLPELLQKEARADA